MPGGRWTAGLGVVAAMVVIAVAVGGCGSSDGSSTGDGSGVSSAAKAGWAGTATKEHVVAKPHSKLVRWSLGSVPHGRQIKIEAVAGYCGAGKRPLISKVRVREEGSKVLLGAVLTEFNGPGPCAGVGVGVSKTVTLAKPLGRRGLYDASVNPPAKRWPRG
jgi:hypothetical protein